VSRKKNKKTGEQKSGNNSSFEYTFLAVLTMSLLALGVVMVFSASWANAFFGENKDSYYYLKRELMFAVPGVLLMFALARIDYRKILKVSHLLMVAAIGMLVAVFIPGVGVEVNGANSWISLGLFNFQPSEFAKLAIILYIAARMYKKPRLLGSLNEMVLPVIGLPLMACLLIAAEPDLGTTSIICVAIIMMLLVGGIRLHSMVLVGAGGVVLAIMSLTLFPHQRGRIASYADSMLHFWDISFIRSWSEAQDSGFQLVQSLVAMGSGGLLGIGLGESIQKFNYLPEAHTDMILSIIGEELGLAGVIAVIIGYGAFAYIGFRIALKCSDRFGKFVAAGITSLLVSQAAINVSAATGILPLTGIPLPLISYGGSSLIVILAGIGILLNISVNPRGRVVTARFKSIEGGHSSGRDGRPSGSSSRPRRRSHG
jgi:cell division protein FtsW